MHGIVFMCCIAYAYTALLPRFPAHGRLIRTIRYIRTRVLRYFCDTDLLSERHSDNSAREESHTTCTCVVHQTTPQFYQEASDHALLKLFGVPVQNLGREVQVHVHGKSTSAYHNYLAETYMYMYLGTQHPFMLSNLRHLCVQQLYATHLHTCIR